jgi:hypothetical protein
LVITAEFDGILPKEAHEKERAAAGHFDNLFLVVDQQYRAPLFFPDLTLSSIRWRSPRKSWNRTRLIALEK